MTNIKQIRSNLYFVKDLAKTADFYNRMGFETRTANDAVIIKFDDFALCFIDESKAQIDKEVGIEPKGIGVFTYVEVENVDEQYEHVIENNLSPSSKPTSFPWGKREFAIKDPDGYKIVIYQDIEEK